MTDVHEIEEKKGKIATVNFSYGVHSFSLY